MQRLIDCTYLHSVTRCLRGNASHPDDLANFLRVVGEVLLADRLIFTADKSGPVYGPAIVAAAEFESAIGDATFLKHFEIPAADHAIFCDKAAIDISADLGSIDISARVGGMVSPHFENAIKDPDADFLSDLQKIVRNRRRKVPELVLNSANVSRFVLTRPKVIEALRESKILDSLAEKDEFLRLTAAVRSMVYRHIGKRLRAAYLPATSRAKLLTSNGRNHEDTIGDLPADIGSGGPLFSLASAVDALVRLSHGDPNEILRRAWQHRNTMLPLREYLVPRIQGDALGTSFKKVAQIRSMTKEFEGIVGGDQGPRLMDALEFQFIFFGVPIVKIQGGKFRDWFDRKRAMRRTGRFADLIRDAKQLHAVSAYEKLVRRAGFKDDPLKIVDAGGDDRPPRLR